MKIGSSLFKIFSLLALATTGEKVIKEKESYSPFIMCNNLSLPLNRMVVSNMEVTNIMPIEVGECREILPEECTQVDTDLRECEFYANNRLKGYLYFFNNKTLGANINLYQCWAGCPHQVEKDKIVIDGPNEDYKCEPIEEYKCEVPININNITKPRL